MAQARRQLNATILPDGRVLATGGTSSPGFSDPTGGVHAAEVWNPDDGTWTTWASNRVTRVYHSATLLLPDARILHAGSGDDGGTLPRELNAEIFSPPYLFLGVRPSITSAPGFVGYGEQFFVATPDAGQVVRATFVRPSSVTHSFDENQRFVELSLVRAAGGLSITAPADGNIAPPGNYMLFIMNSKGVPSVSRMVRLDRPGQLLRASVYPPRVLPGKTLSLATLAKQAAWASVAKDSVCRAPWNGDRYPAKQPRKGVQAISDFRSMIKADLAKDNAKISLN